MNSPRISTTDLFNHLKQHSIDLTSEQQNEIEKHLRDRLNYVPRIAIFGKTGAGKSSLMNALFGQPVSMVNHVQACTRDLQEVELNVRGKRVILIDCPGVAESEDRDVEYAKLYRDLLSGQNGHPAVDCILWVLKGDDRAFKADADFYKNLIKPACEQNLPFLFVLNQVDKIEPFRQWDEDRCQPGMEQRANIDRKKAYVSECFVVPPSQVIDVSAVEQYRLDILVYEMISQLRDQRCQVVLGATLDQAVVNERTSSHLDKSLWSLVFDAVETVVPVLKPALYALKGVKKVFKSVGRFFRFW